MTYKKDSLLMNKVIKNTNLSTIEFKTCIAGTFTHIQMFCMLMIEWIYHQFYTQVKFHREIFRFKDGGQIAMDWAFEMP